MRHETVHARHKIFVGGYGLVTSLADFLCAVKVLEEVFERRLTTPDRNQQRASVAMLISQQLMSPHS